MGTENRQRPLRYLVKFVDKYSPSGPQFFDHVVVVNDFVADVDRRVVPVHRALDNFDGPFDAGAEAARLGEEDTQGFQRIRHDSVISNLLMRCKLNLTVRWGRPLGLHGQNLQPAWPPVGPEILQNGRKARQPFPETGLRA